MKKTNFIIPAILALITSFLFLQCSKNSYNNNSGSNGNNTNTIYMKNSAYSNTNLTVSVGGTVTWVNNDNMVHTVTANDGSFNSFNIQMNSSFSMTFTKTGTYPYHCIYHPNMTGTIVVISAY